MSKIDNVEVKRLKKQLELRDYKAFNQLVEIMKDVKNTERVRKEAAYVVFLKSYNEGNMIEGKRAMEWLLQFVKEVIYKDWFATLVVNAAFYMVPLHTTILHNLKQKNFHSLSSLNPFLFRDPETNDYLVGIRCMNLTSNKGSEYDIFVYGEDGMLRGNFPMTYQLQYKRYPRINSTKGVEDVRVISYRDRFIGTGTTMDTHPEGIIRMSLFYLVPQRLKGERKTITKLVAQALVPLRGYEDNQKQKNWLPFVSDDKLHFIYKSDPITVLRAKEDSGVLTGEVEKIHQDKCFMAPKQRGNTPPIPYTNPQGEECWLYITHCAETKHRVYYHRLIEMDKQFKMTRISCMFYFERNNGIEFAVNMIVVPGQDEFLISYGVKDEIARVSKVRKRDIEDLFQLRQDLLAPLK